MLSLVGEQTFTYWSADWRDAEETFTGRFTKKWLLLYIWILNL